MRTSARKKVSKDKIIELVYSLSEGELRLKLYSDCYRIILAKSHVYIKTLNVSG
jgi:hypothetical protein